MSDCGCGPETAEALQRKTLRTLLAINGAMFFIEAAAGLLADSTGLLADSLDMLADASVYGIALLAVGRSAAAKSHAALVSGFLQMALGLGVLLDVGRRFLVGSDPISGLIMSVGAIALAANVTCLSLISRHRHEGVHMRASWIFSKNDVIANLGIIASGALVWMSGSRLPDLAIGTVISLIVIAGGREIVKDARAAATASQPTGA